MMKIGIVTDSVSNLPQEFQEKENIKVLPVTIRFGNEVYQEGVNLLPQDFYRMLETVDEVPWISAPASREFLEMFESMRQEGFEGAVCILSCRICQSYNQVCEARDFARPFPAVVVDSHLATMSQGFMVMEAARAAEQGLAITDIVERVWQIRKQVHFYGLAGMLHYLVRSGHLSKGSAYMKALLNIQQLITIDKETGEFIPAGKVKHRQGGYDFIKNQMEQAAASGGKLHAAVLHANEADEADRLYQSLSGSLDCAEIYLQDLSPAVVCHLGPGVVGASYFVENGSGQQ